MESMPPPAASSGIGESVLSVLRESTAVPLGALLMVSDGADNSGRFGRDLMAEIRKYNVPVHTIGVGREHILGISSCRRCPWPRARCRTRGSVLS